MYRVVLRRKMSDQQNDDKNNKESWDDGEDWRKGLKDLLSVKIVKLKKKKIEVEVKLPCISA